MSAEDAREDVIENDPVSGVDDTSVDEKTWGWLVLQSSTTGCMFKGRPLISFFKLCSSLCCFRWHSFRTLCDYNKRICLGEKATAWDQIDGFRNKYGRSHNC